MDKFLKNCKKSVLHVIKAHTSWFFIIGQFCAISNNNIGLNKIVI